MYKHYNTRHNEIKQNKWNQMSSEIDTITDALGLPIDANIKETVIVLNLLGFATNGSCEGHLNWGTMAPWVDLCLGSYRSNPIFFAKQQEYYEMIECRSELMNEPLNDTTCEFWRKSHLIEAEIHILANKHFDKIRELLVEFYKNRIIDHDSILYLENGCNFGYRLTTIGHKWQVNLNEKNRQKQLTKYQKEMHDFTEFLKNYYYHS